MKILHTSDWHLGKRLEDYSRFEEQQEVLSEICDIAEREDVNAVLIAGDLFDAYNPPAEATELFYKVLRRLSDNGKRAVIAIAGNHDSPDRIEAPDPLARACGIIFAGYPYSVVPPFELDSGLKVLDSEEGFIHLKLTDVEETLRIILTPYANEFRIRTYLGHENSEEELRKVLESKWQRLVTDHCDEKGVNILIAHLLIVKNAGEIPEEPDDEKPIFHAGGTSAIYSSNIPREIQYTALGHLHRKQYVNIDHNNPMVYPGSPLAYSFSEANQKKYVIILDIEAGKQPGITEIELKSGKTLLRKRANSIEEAVQWLQENQNCLVELTIVTDTFLTAEDRRSLYAIHDGIVTLIPEVKNAGEFWCPPGHHIDLTKNMDELFKEFFKHNKGQEPNDNIIRLFKEVLSEDENEN